MLALAGDQLYVDLDLSVDNLPAGSRLAVGDAVIEVTAEPHTGCAKFTRRFGLAAHRWINGRAGQAERLRGICAKVVVADVMQKEGEEVAASIKTNAGEARFMKLDVSSEKDWNALVDATLKACGEIS